MSAVPHSALVLASGSPRRLELLQQVGIEPARLLATAVDETPERSEHPRSLAKRLSRAKALAAHAALAARGESGGTFVLGADTVVSLGRQVVPKAEIAEDAITNLRILSGRSHRVFTGVCVVTPGGKARQRLVETRIRFKRLSRDEIERYVDSGEWQGKAGGYAIQGLAGGFVVRLVGSYSNVVGLPLYETLSLLTGEGFVMPRPGAAPAA
ncbi:septum formation protein Maf [Aureimonas flava]|uniref:dTTP/UTP pyrophosphatase n=1 Tax=Aureimonas flava TaxID=2320271 RepID=A0A3A1WI30_9HYPH|nr:Maf family nucleotide pyrophosphatase [Aureimonas flava]RIX99185.1 septum formation protein Maf [Aureimonas flava]